MAVSGLRWQMRVHKKRRHSGRRAWATVLLFAVLMQAADAFAVQGQTAAWGSFGAMLLREDAGGYVLVGVVSFAAAAAITALCFRLRNRENCRKGGEDKPARHEKEEKSQ